MKRPTRRGRSGTKPQNLIPDIHRRAVIRWENGMPVGPFANSFNNFLATLARRHDFFNIFLTWKSQRIDALRFFFLDDYACAWTYCFTQINLSFKRWRFELKKKYFIQRTKDCERYWHLDERVDGVDFFALYDYWDTAEIQDQAETARRNRNAPRSYEHHGGSRSFSQHYHQLALEGRGELGHFADRILTGWSPNYADEVKKAQNRDLAEKLHAKVQEQLSQTQVDSNTPTRLSREEEDSIIETVIGPSRKNRYRWRGSEHRPYESSSTYESAAPPGCSSSQDPTMEQRMKAMEDWQSRRESELL
ncbi:uncharacterized protein LOC109846204 [Asparagus officinalis]|uniref:uncharacterized protein LOC109846204 n=1 Tax=Asparagus officinalis TaxID=4686 RepID=UPI00098E0A6C|nr:uncharacterized protein LOC109846204 [Asparagus officinalis]